MEKFSIKQIMTGENNKVLILSLEGILDSNQVFKLLGVLKNCMDNRRLKIIINLEKLKYICSTGLGAFIFIIDKFRKHAGDIRFSNIPGKLWRLFEMLDFQSSFKIFDTQEQAIASFRKNNVEISA